MADRALHSPAFLAKLINYDPETGAMVWRERSLEMFQKPGTPAERQAASWNSKWAGKPVFTKVDGYAMGKIMGVRYSAHRVAWALHYGRWPSQHIDHINGLRGDNRIANLRDVHPILNNRNLGLYRNNKTGVPGINPTKEGGWGVRMSVRGKTTYIGTYPTFEDAVLARKRAECEFGYHPNHGMRPSHETIVALAVAALSRDP